MSSDHRGLFFLKFFYLIDQKHCLCISFRSTIADVAESTDILQMDSVVKVQPGRRECRGLPIAVPLPCIFLLGTATIDDAFALFLMLLQLLSFVALGCRYDGYSLKTDGTASLLRRRLLPSMKSESRKCLLHTLEWFDVEFGDQSPLFMAASHFSRRSSRAGIS